MWIKFKKPAPGYAYSDGDKADLKPEEKAVRLVEEGYAIPLSNERPESDIPEDFPARALLISEGMYTLKQVREAIPSIGDIKGIGKGTIDKIVERLAEPGE